MPGWRLEYLQYPRLIRNAARPAASIRRLQDAALGRLAEHARLHVPFYHDLFRSAGFAPRERATLDSFSALPLTSKETLHGLSVAERTADDIDLKRCRSFSTSGTTGIPLKSFFTQQDTVLKNLAWIRAQKFCGLKPGHRIAVLVGQRETARRPSAYERLGLWRRFEVSSWGEPASWLAELRRWRPDVLLGYVMTLKLLAEELMKTGSGLPLQAVFHSSAYLDGPSRRFLEQAFGCPVRDFYGSDEAGCIAWECPKCSGYHIAADMVIVEILKDDRPAAPGEAGEVVVTNLYSRAMPFIRYRQGDVAVLSERRPVCGVQFPLLERIEGRTDDFLVLPGRGKVTPHIVYHLMDPVAGLARWRITQTEALRLAVECEPVGVPPADLVPRIESQLRRLVPASVALEIQIIDRIPVPPDRKFRAVSSAVERPGP